MQIIFNIIIFSFQDKLILNCTVGRIGYMSGLIKYDSEFHCKQVAKKP